MPDFVCIHKPGFVNIIIESVMSYRTLPEIREHADRFGGGKGGKTQYQAIESDGVKCLRGLVIIGGNEGQIKNAMAGVKLDAGNGDLQIMGLCPMSGYQSMKFFLHTPSTVKDYVISCNMVPQRLREGNLVVGHTFGKSCV